LKAVMLNLLAVAAAWGLMVLVWQQGFGSSAIWGIQATRAINVEMPIVIFAFLFGVSMDYQVFIISRMREAYDRTQSTDAAVVEGIGRTGRLVTSAALILALAFVAMSASPGTEVKIFATALGGGILLDATLIRGVLAPALVVILGRWNWWLPDRAARILRVKPSPVQPLAALRAGRPARVAARTSAMRVDGMTGQLEEQQKTQPGFVVHANGPIDGGWGVKLGTFVEHGRRGESLFDGPTVAHADPREVADALREGGSGVHDVHDV